MPIAGTHISIDSTEGMDKITQTEKVTSPYFSGGTTELLGASIISASLSDTNEKYFFGIANSSTATTEEFNVSFGSTNGYGVLMLVQVDNYQMQEIKKYMFLVQDEPI